LPADVWADQEKAQSKYQHTSKRGHQSSGAIMQDLITVKVAADALQVSKWTLYQWIAAGYVPHVRLGAKAVRIRANDLEEIMENGFRRPAVRLN
jgi:excisionase family DNA binding protein